MSYNMVVWDIGVDAPITTDEPLPEMPGIMPGDVLVLSGRAPIWRYLMALHRAHGSAACAIAAHDPRLGNVVVATHNPAFVEGQIL